MSKLKYQLEVRSLFGQPSSTKSRDEPTNQQHAISLTSFQGQVCVDSRKNGNMDIDEIDNIASMSSTPRIAAFPKQN